MKELRWAQAGKKRFIPVIRANDKNRIGDLLALAPDDLKVLGQTEFITLDRSDKDYWRVGVDKILRAFALLQAANTDEGTDEVTDEGPATSDERMNPVFSASNWADPAPAYASRESSRAGAKHPILHLQSELGHNAY